MIERHTSPNWKQHSDSINATVGQCFPDVSPHCRFACGLFIAPLIQAFIETNTTYMLEQLGLTFRNALMGAIYRKTLRLSSSALSTDGTGKIVTLMSNDASKLQVRSGSVIATTPYIFTDISSRYCMGNAPLQGYTIQ
jgi:hypothetical protein